MKPIEDAYTITDLERETGLSRRTIHFYAAAQLIPPPTGSGGGARYGEEHLLRLRLIRELKKTHLKLNGIREALDAMSPEEMRRAAAGAAPPTPAATKEALGEYLENLGTGHLSFRDLGRGTPSPQQSLLPPGGEDRDGGRQRHLLSSYLSALGRTTGARPAASWERVELAEGLELHVRGDAAARLEGLVKEIARLAAARKP